MLFTNAIQYTHYSITYHECSAFSPICHTRAHKNTKKMHDIHKSQKNNSSTINSKNDNLARSDTIQGLFVQEFKALDSQSIKQTVL